MWSSKEGLNTLNFVKCNFSIRMIPREIKKHILMTIVLIIKLFISKIYTKGGVSPPAPFFYTPANSVNIKLIPSDINGSPSLSFFFPVP